MTKTRGQSSDRSSHAKRMERLTERLCGLDVEMQTVTACMRIPGRKGRANNKCGPSKRMRLRSYASA